MTFEHDATARRFVVTDPANGGELSYHVRSDGALEYFHTGVTPSLQGRGIGAALVEFALIWARDHGHRVIPACSFVRHWIQTHPEFQPGEVLDR